MTVINLETGQVLARQLHLADNFWRRFWGLLLFKKIAPDEGLLLTPCRSVHTCFMRFTIDVIILDNSQKVVAVYPWVKPWRMLTGPNNGKHVLELPPGTSAATGTIIGHHLFWEKSKINTL